MTAGHKSGRLAVVARPRYVEAFDPGRAQRSVRSVVAAHDRWLGFREPPPVGPSPSRGELEELSFRAGMLVVEVVRWVRVVDEYLSDRGDSRGRPGYPASVRAAAEVSGTLDGIAHAADRSLHRLVGLECALSTPSIVRGSVFPGGTEIRRNDPPCFWPDLSHLPSRSNERDRDRAKSQGYATYLAAQPIDPALARAVTFLERFAEE